MKIAVDLIWWRFKSMGGVESYIKNLLKGFARFAPNNITFSLIVAKDNKKNIQLLELPHNSEIIESNVCSQNMVKAMLFQACKIQKIASEISADIIFVPTPIYPIRNGRVPTVVTIHDLKLLHYPQYAKGIQKLKYILCWKSACKNANKIVAISDFVKKDIIKSLHVNDDLVCRIYNPVQIDEERVPFKKFQTSFGIKERQYFYTISSLAPHKNTYVLLKVLKKIREKPLISIPKKLVISGIGKSKHQEILNFARSLSIEKDVILTGYVSDSERNTLYDNAYAFLFPSLFEGFGMPPIEAMMLGIPVITTKCASIPEVTKGKAFYVTNPFDIEEWYEKIKLVRIANREPLDFPEYDIRIVVNNYIELFASLLANNLKYRGYIHGQN